MKTVSQRSSRNFRAFKYKEANFRICCERFDTVTKEIVAQRELLEAYIKTYPAFASALTPLPETRTPPPIARRMFDASRKVGVGPMAAVAGITAQFAAEAAIEQGVDEVIVENGGDIFFQSPREVVVGIYAGKSPLSGKIAFSIKPDAMPLAMCSSSSKMGHSLSLGDCDLATVISKDAAIADAAATHACNSVRRVEQIQDVLEMIATIDGVIGALIIKDDQCGIIGDLPEIIKFDDPRFAAKITMDADSGYSMNHGKH